MNHRPMVAQEVERERPYDACVPSERLVRPVTERRSLRVLALAQRDVFLYVHGELNRFKPGSLV
jgi:hypothetical protein